jgi:hypothetical protein
MSYKLADGSCSTDYKIGDEFMLRTTPVRIFVFKEDDGTAYPWFQERGIDDEYARHWEDLTPVQAKKNANVINQLRETIKQLEATIQELER